MNYQDYLKSNHWKALKTKAFNLLGKYCCVCSWKENLQVHHLWYNDNYDWFKTEVTHLRVLCDACHCRYHEETKVLFTEPKKALYNFETFRKKSGTFIRKEKRRLETPKEYEKRLKREAKGNFSIPKKKKVVKPIERKPLIRQKPVFLFPPVIFKPSIRKPRAIPKPKLEIDWPRSTGAINRPWDDDDTQYLINEYNNKDFIEISKHLNRSIEDINNRIKYLHDEYLISDSIIVL